MTKALILAAGPGPLFPLEGTPLIGRALDALLEAGVKDAVVVTGHGAAALEAYLDTRRDVGITTVEHREHASTGALAAFAAAAHLIDDEFVLLDGGIVFEPAVVSRLLGPGTRLAVDPLRALDDDTMKVAADGERIVAVSSRLSLVESVGEAIGMAKIEADTGERLFIIARRLLEAGGRAMHYASAFEALIEDGDVFELADITGLRWARPSGPQNPAMTSPVTRPDSPPGLLRPCFHGVQARYESCPLCKSVHPGGPDHVRP